MKKSLKLALVLTTFIIFSNILGSILWTTALDKAVPDAEVDTAWNDHLVDGSGQKIAIIDTGIDWTHPDFFRVIPGPVIVQPGGGTHPFGGGLPDIYIDMDNSMTADPGEYPVKILDVGIINNSGEFYGSNDTNNSYDWDIDFLYVDNDGDGWNYSVDPIFIAEAPSSPDLDIGTPVLKLDQNLSKIEKMWDQTTGNIYTRGVNLTDAGINTEKDYDGHGTHVAGIAAGGKVGRKYVGVVPGADLLIVKVDGWSDQNVADGIDWAVDEGADVISLSFGLFYKNWTLDGAPYGEGGSLSGEAMEDAWQAGVPVVTSAGNVGDKNAHATLNVASSSSVNDLLVVPSDPTIQQLGLTFLWRSPNNNVSVSLMTPNGIMFHVNDSISSEGQWFVASNISGTFFHYYLSYMQNNSRGTSKAYIYIVANTNSSVNATYINNQLDPGPWTIDVSNHDASPQTVEEYVYSAQGDQRHFFVFSGAAFQSGNPNMTVTAPATADHAIAVGSHITSPSGNRNLGNISAFSSRGSRIDGYQFHMITAPGESLTSARSKNSPGTGNYTTMSGTSMATPMVAGAIALAIQNNTDIKTNLTYMVECLENSTIRDAYVTSWGSVPNNAFGYGKLNATNFIHMTSTYSATDMPPEITGPGTLAYIVGETSNQVQWSITDDVGLVNYTVYRESINITNGTLSGTTDSVAFNVDGWNYGEYNVTILVFDMSGNSVQDEVTVNVTLGQPPAISGPSSIEYIAGQIPDQVDWNMTDDVGLLNYTIFVEGVNVSNGSLSSTSDSVVFDVDGWPVGEYNVTILVFDISGNSVQDEVTVNVTLGQPPVITGPNTISYDEGTTSSPIQWSIADDVGLLNYTIFKDGSPLTSNTISGTSNTTMVNAGGWAVGEYNVTIVVTDISGNIVQDEVVVTVTVPSSTSDIPGYPFLSLIGFIAITAFLIAKKHHSKRE